MSCENQGNPTNTKPALWSGLVKWACACKFNPIDAALNIYGALVDIANSVRELSDNLEAKGYAVAGEHFRVAGGQAATNGQLWDNILVKSAYNKKIVGFGASVLSFPTSGGAQPDDDVLTVRLYDYTAGSFVGDPIVLTSASRHGSVTDDGNSIGPNITPGHDYGVKITYTNTDAGAFTKPDVDVFIYSQPLELSFNSP